MNLNKRPSLSRPQISYEIMTLKKPPFWQEVLQYSTMISLLASLLRLVGFPIEHLENRRGDQLFDLRELQQSGRWQGENLRVYTPQILEMYALINAAFDKNQRGPHAETCRKGITCILDFALGCGMLVCLSYLWNSWVVDQSFRLLFTIWDRVICRGPKTERPFRSDWHRVMAHLENAGGVRFGNSTAR